MGELQPNKLSFIEGLMDLKPSQPSKMNFMQSLDDLKPSQQRVGTYSYDQLEQLRKGEVSSLNSGSASAKFSGPNDDELTVYTDDPVIYNKIREKLSEMGENDLSKFNVNIEKKRSVFTYKGEFYLSVDTNVRLERKKTFSIESTRPIIEEIE
jgi:hypothetical protein